MTLFLSSKKPVLGKEKLGSFEKEREGFWLWIILSVYVWRCFLSDFVYVTKFFSPPIMWIFVCTHIYGQFVDSLAAAAIFIWK